MSTDVLGRVVEGASGMTLDRFVESNIYRPLGMDDTFSGCPAENGHDWLRLTSLGQTAYRKIAEKAVVNTTSRLASLFSSDYPYCQIPQVSFWWRRAMLHGSDYMRFCQMLLNGGKLNGVRLLRAETVKMMTTDQLGNLNGRPVWVWFRHQSRHTSRHGQLRGILRFGGFWSTSFRISPRGDWVVITMPQLAWDFD